MQPTTPPFVIREALELDIPNCLELDHRYETEHVWQMSIQPQSSGWTINFRTERLPRIVEAKHLTTSDQLQYVLDEQDCFLVAALKEQPRLIGYLAMHREHTHGNATIHHIVVDAPYRRQNVGKRLLTIAQRWALEHDIRHLFFETQTQNYPAIEFCQSFGFAFCGFNDQIYPNNDIGVYFGKSTR
ncbi:GNAT family N-acetyltransferase [Phototrophicus methaneseepsis]|uniref:GNAT family N-acetyltransferase n=1 Tax=Phototrophicus methaneseepsis TaxID=2710758 RepID=A0A7S8IDD9_9CHLR|nr:GNAT family N-acetyltransferase [Phototrophicus methaneseepsis]QPC80698.1 GNAT family N-acetyltransferase [Phototrophicus methaneseepsis]